MRNRWNAILAGAALATLAAGCASEPIGPQDPDAELLETFEAMAAEANRVGDAEAAASLAGGSLALRMGVRPGVIMVSIDGQPVRHFALVAGVTRQIGGETVLLRSLFAWTGERGPRTILEVTMPREEGVFGGTPPARGSYTRMAERERYLATSGGGTIAVAELGEACGRPLSENPNLDCRKARYTVAVEGTFHLLSPVSRQATDTRLVIRVPESPVPGVVVAPSGGE